MKSIPKKVLDVKEDGLDKALQIVLHYALYALLEVVKQGHLVKVLVISALF
jgi:hypothetical protein